VRRQERPFETTSAITAEPNSTRRAKNPSRKHRRRPSGSRQRRQGAQRPTASNSLAAFCLDWRVVIFTILIVATVFTRFSHLGLKPHHQTRACTRSTPTALHRGDYEYNPMMHGPFQFHGNALMYYFFGSRTRPADISPVFSAS
jgi:hypothetical protein